MKRITKIITVNLLLSMALLTCSCGSKKETEIPEKEIMVDEIEAEEIVVDETEVDEPEVNETEVNETEVNETEVDEPLTPQPTEGVDVDLTIMSSTAVYGEVYSMMCSPDQYIGKTIRMEGLYSDFYDEALDKHYFACMIMDATACCAQGIEFELKDDYAYPDDYPSDGDDITVEGVFDVYTEEDGSYCTLRNAALITGGA